MLFARERDEAWCTLVRRVAADDDPEVVASELREAMRPRIAARPGDLQLQIALARGATVRDAAKAAGVAERTAHRRLSDPSFRAEVDRLRNELQQKIVEKVAVELSTEHFNESDTDESSIT